VIALDNAPEIVLHPVDLHENVVEVAALMKERTHRLNAAPPDPDRKIVPPEMSPLSYDALSTSRPTEPNSQFRDHVTTQLVGSYYA
jgi:hypothetical protein